ncbi:MAG TPA: SigE family RNA polymerase sigma factor [Candidatus Limnocylindrales bacterium]|nr:SigE family RNA polymerase sigma factor [Candidatus Limnocylindrales bacterium]
MREDDDAEYTAYVSARLVALHRAAYLLCGGDKIRADEIVQVTITKLYQRWKKASRADDLDAYVHRMLVNAHIDEWRGSWARVWLLPKHDDGIKGIDEQYVGVDDRALVVAALRTLPPRQRAVLVLRFLLDRPIEQVAQILRCSEGTVKSHSSRGLAALRTVIQDHQKTIGIL